MLWAKTKADFRVLVFILLIFELQKYKLDFYHMIYTTSELVNVWLKNNSGILVWV